MGANGMGANEVDGGRERRPLDWSRRRSRNRHCRQPRRWGQNRPRAEIGAGGEIGSEVSTAVELVATLGIAALLAAAAVPGFAALRRSTGLTAAANELLGAIHLAPKLGRAARRSGHGLPHGG